jgi:hypothetical protein
MQTTKTTRRSLFGLLAGLAAVATIPPAAALAAPEPTPGPSTPIMAGGAQIGSLVRVPIHPPGARPLTLNSATTSGGGLNIATGAAASTVKAGELTVMVRVDTSELDAAMERIYVEGRDLAVRRARQV